MYNSVIFSGRQLWLFLFASLYDPKWGVILTLLHQEGPKLHRVLALQSAIGLKERSANPHIREAGSEMGVT